MTLMKKTLTLFMLSLFVNAEACTDIQLEAMDHSVIVGRTMDFDRPLNSALAIYPRGEQRSSLKPDGSKGLSWTSRYAYAGMNELGNRQMISDGINEQGLALEDLWLAETQYNPILPTDQAVILLYDLPAWLLGNFSSVAEVKKNLPLIKVWANKIAVLHSVTPLHFAVHDRTGANCVIEFLNGQTVILDNPVGVLTNSPTFAWQLTNLNNYARLSNQNSSTSTWGDLTVSPTGPGSGLLGVPGDYTPVSRFVKAAVLVRFMEKLTDSRAATQRMMHVLNNFDVPFNAIADSKATYSGGDYSQWSMIKNLSSLTVYIRPSYSMNFYQVDLSVLFAKVKSFQRVALTNFIQQDQLNVTSFYQ